VIWANEYRTHSRLAAAYRRGNVFLAGDAAHLNSPVGGQGMNVGIGDALDLATRLVNLYRAAPPEILDGYEVLRRSIAERVINTTRQATRMLTARKPVERLVRNQLMRLAHRLPPFQRRLSTETAFVSQS
jgi:4,5-epoxidase